MLQPFNASLCHASGFLIQQNKVSTEKLAIKTFKGLHLKFIRDNQKTSQNTTQLFNWALDLRKTQHTPTFSCSFNKNKKDAYQDGNRAPGRKRCDVMWKLSIMTFESKSHIYYTPITKWWDLHFNFKLQVQGDQRLPVGWIWSAGLKLQMCCETVFLVWGWIDKPNRTELKYHPQHLNSYFVHIVTDA